MLSIDKSFIDFNLVLEDVIKANPSIQKPDTLDTNNIIDRSFILIDSEFIEDSEDFLSDKEWSLILNNKKHKILFQQNLFTIKNHIIKKGTNSNK